MNTSRNISLSFLLLAFSTSSLLAYTKPAYGPGQVRLDVQEQAAQKEFENIRIEDRLGEQVSINELVFTDESGKEAPLASYLGENKPTLVAMLYYECPSLCGLLMNGIVNSLRRMDWRIGQEFNVVFVSIDHEEGPDLATMKKESYLKDYGSKEAASGWHFLTGTKGNVEKLASELGFGFKYVEDINEYAHSAGFFVLDRDGIISRVLYGVEFDPLDVKLALLEAAQGKVGSIVDRVLLFCYRFDPNSKGYALHALNIVRAGGGVFLLIMFTYLFIFWRRQVKPRSDNG